MSIVIVGTLIIRPEPLRFALFLAIVKIILTYQISTYLKNTILTTFLTLKSYEASV